MAPEARTKDDASAAEYSPESGYWTVPLDEQESEPSNGGPDPEPSTERKHTYLAIDGIEHADLDDADKEIVEKRVIDFLLREGYPISGARIIDDAHVVEVEPSPDQLDVPTHDELDG